MLVFRRAPPSFSKATSASLGRAGSQGPQQPPWAGIEPARKARQKGRTSLEHIYCQPNPAASWKQEVSQRIAAHQSRRGLFRRPAGLVRPNPAVPAAAPPRPPPAWPHAMPGSQLQPDAGGRSRSSAARRGSCSPGGARPRPHRSPRLRARRLSPPARACGSPRFHSQGRRCAPLRRGAS